MNQPTDPSVEEKEPKQTASRSFFKKLAATARLTRKEAYRRKLESIDLKQAEYQIGEKAYDSRVVPVELGGLVSDLDDITARIAALQQRQDDKPASSFGEKAQAAASTAASRAKVEALKLKRNGLLKDLGSKLRRHSAPNAALTNELAAANAVQEQIKSLDAEIATLRRDSWTKHPLPFLVAAIIAVVLVVGIISLGHGRRVTQVSQPKQQQKSDVSNAQAAQLAAMRQQQEQMIARMHQAEQARLQSVQDRQRQYDEAARAAIEKKKQEQAAGDEVERQKAEVQKRLQEQMAQKQEESRRQALEEQKGRVAQGQQKAQEVTKKRQEIVAKIVRTKAKIEEQEVAPTGAAVKYAVSPHALHIAAATLRGSRSLMVIDNVSGPAFDELIWVPGGKFEAIDTLVQHGDPQRSLEGMDREQAPVVFSEDGTRFAYVGRQGDQYVLMVDGKEVGRGAYISERDSPPVTNLSFVPGSNRLRYVRRIPRPPKETDDSTKFRGVQLVVEGDKNPPMETLPDSPISFSRDGQHYAYFFDLSSDDTSTYYERYRHLVVDGKLDPPEFTVPGFTSTSGVALFTGDSKHLITARSKTMPDPERTRGFTKGPVTIFFDKNPVLEAPHVEVLQTDARTNKKVARPHYSGLEELSVAPVGTNYIAVFGVAGNPQVSSSASHYRIFFNDRQVADVPKVETIVWSPDGKRYMVKCETKNNSQFMVIDGKKEPEYRSVSFHSNRQSGGYSKTKGFTADSSNSVYLAETDKQFLVVEGAESDGYKAIDELTFTDKGGHFGFVATDDGGSRILVIDGRASEPRKDARDLVLTSDATHYGFVSGNRDFPLPVIDGIEQPFLLADDLIHYTFGPEPEKHFLFSPDGKHFAFCALSGSAPNSKSDESLKHNRGFCLDGQLLACENCGLGTYGRCEMRPFFTPDNRHIVWLAWDTDARGVAGCSVFVDGQQEAHFECPPIKHTVHGTGQNVGYFFAHAEDAAEIGPDGVLTFFVPVENAVKRIRVVPSGDTSLARFAGIAQEQQMGAQDKAEQESTRSN